MSYYIDTTIENKKCIHEDFIHLDSISCYLREIGHKKLLTAEQEITLGKRIKSGDSAARATMIESNLRLVVNLARRYANLDFPLIDLIAEGNIGLIRAVDKYNPEKGYRFSTYATWWINDSINRALMNQSRTVRIPVHVIKKIRSIKRVERDLQKDLRRNPNLREVAKELGCSVDEIIECLDKESELISLDVEYGDSNISLLDSLADLDTQNTLQNLVDQEISVSLSRWINTLNEEHRQVLYWRFGFGSNETLTLKEIANNWGISLERVRQIQNKAIKTLRCRIEKDGLSADSIFP